MTGTERWKEPETKSLFVHNWVEMDSKDGKYKIKIDPFFFETEFLQTKQRSAPVTGQ